MSRKKSQTSKLVLFGKTYDHGDLISLQTISQCRCNTAETKVIDTTTAKVFLEEWHKLFSKILWQDLEIGQGIVITFWEHLDTFQVLQRRGASIYHILSLAYPTE